ncbi:MAG TPA: thioredoxin family protein [Bryobacteraceae bacterium]|jgi:thiol-disulfide isomerase/thioredoxin|nr:thioredoxin family protein [Bryobacteraceae bacterium]
MTWRISALLGVALAALPAAAQPEKIVRADLTYQQPGDGPKPDFSPYGTQIKLSDLPADAGLPAGAARPAKSGTLQVGPNETAWIEVLATADAEHPHDLCRLYLDRNRNRNFNDDGPPLVATPAMNQKTKAWWSSFNRAELSVPYGAGAVEPYMVNFWAVREGEDVPAVIRYSVASWRSGAVKVDGVDALVAMMDSNNDAVFDDKDHWSVLGASEANAAKRVLSYREARPSNRLMFVPRADGQELVLEFRGVTPDGRSLSFAVVDRKVTKAADRAPDDTLAAERARPRTTQPFPWIAGDLEKGVAEAKASGRKTIVDFWTSWCGPCHSLDEWIWSDAEVAAALSEGYVGVKFDGDLSKDAVARFHVEGYPTLIVLDSSGKEVRRFGYMTSQEMLTALKH